MKIIKLFLVIGVMVLTGSALAYVPAGKVCCADDVSMKDCCESNDFVWCSDSNACVRYSEYCDFLCPAHVRAYDCTCPAATISVLSQNMIEQPYCCAKGETLQACCQALGFTWVGPTVNTGKCSAPNPDVCIKYITEVSDGLVH